MKLLNSSIAQDNKRLTPSRSFSHWTPRYVWCKSLVALEQSLHSDWPWLTGQMVRILDSWLRGDDVGLECGSGRSTLWLARRVSSLTSIEHSKAWHETTSSDLRRWGLGNVSYLYKPEEEGYVQAISEIRDESLDFMLNDGIARDACAVCCIDKLKPGGVMIIDNCNRYVPSRSSAPESRGLEEGPATETWSLFLEMIRNWRCIWTSNGVWDTGLWVKPRRTAEGELAPDRRAAAIERRFSGERDI